jgi:hypothetical protein
MDQGKLPRIGGDAPSSESPFPPMLRESDRRTSGHRIGRCPENGRPAKRLPRDRPIALGQTEPILTANA